MNPHDIALGQRVRVTGQRQIAGRTWSGEVGAVWSVILRHEVDDWVWVQIDDDGTLVIGFTPDEVESE